MPELSPVESLTTRAIWEAMEVAQDRDERTYLGASVLGDPCERKLWLAFRWAHEPEWFDGRKLSIFQTGHVWEARLVEMLLAAGVKLDAVDPETGEQFLVRFAGGHAGGHLDGEATAVPDAPTTVHVVEAKSHNDKSFQELKRLGVEKSKPAHFAQMQIYMHGRGRSRALYIAVNKNDDAIYTERVPYDPTFALSMLAKAERIVQAANPPPCNCPPYFLKAGYGCAKFASDRFPRRNCRTCLFSTPRLDGDARWTCDRHSIDLTTEDQRAGCPNHLYIPALIAGDQVDSSEAEEWVEYRMRDGSIFRDGDAMPNRPNLIGDEFGRLIVIEQRELRGTKRTWLCECECGGSTVATTSDLRYGGVASCGCLLSGPTARNARHGHSSREGPSLTYNSWRGMVERCSNPSHIAYANYGGRGIAVCERWQTFEAFLADMGERPSGHSIDRIDNERGYEPGNCRWATSVEQRRNRRDTAPTPIRNEFGVTADELQGALT